MNECQKYREMLTDLFYGEIEMTGELEAHLAGCRECREYAKGLEETGEALDLFAFEPELDIREIRKAFIQVEENQEKREGFREILLFALLGLAYLLVSVLIFSRVGFEFLLYYQIYIYLGLPLFVIPLLRARRMSEGRGREGGRNG